MKIPRDKLLRSPSSRSKTEGSLVQEVAHELSTPLGGILMYSQLILDELAPDHPHRKNLENILGLASRCKVLLQGLRASQCQQAPRREPVNANEVLSKTLRFLEDHVLLRHVSIQTDLDPKLPLISADENNLEQVFVNITINAAQSMNGKGVLLVRTDVVDSKRQVRIAFSDTGCGIGKEHMGEIFKPFFTTKDARNGMGLGLSICDGIVKQHGGTISVHSTKGEGSTFTVLLPMANIVPM